MTTDMEQAPYMGYGRARKVTSIKTSDEVHQTRIREKKEQKLAKQRALIQAVEQAVALPEPLPKPITKEGITENVSPTEEISTEQIQKKTIGTMLGAINSILDRWKNFVLEE